MRRQVGDTLIEVALAVTILGMVLVGGVVLANRAYGAGRAATEETVAVNLLQQQAEALRNFRDANIGSWCTNVYSATVGLTPSFHMAQMGGVWKPILGTYYYGGSGTAANHIYVITIAPSVAGGGVYDPSAGVHIRPPFTEMRYDITATWTAPTSGPQSSLIVSTILVDKDPAAIGNFTQLMTGC